MSTTKQLIKQSLALCLFIASFSAYNPVFAEPTTATAEGHHAENSLDWPGIYHGFTPCADCKGVRTTLALNKNSSYILISQYLGKSEREFVEKGKFTWGNEDNTIVLTPRNGDKTRQYFVGEDQLIQLDDNGKRYTGESAQRYVLRRNEVTGSQPQTHGGHH